MGCLNPILAGHCIVAGPERGVGGKATADAVLGGRSEPVSIEVIEAEAPARNVERNVGAGGRRVATGTYVLVDLPGGGTRVTFEYAWQKIPPVERIFSPLIRRAMRKELTIALQRLDQELRREP